MQSAPQAHSFTREGILFVVSAPSGTGKSTLCDNMRHTPDLYYSVSCTTRPPRPGEIHGEDYYFLSQEEFLKKVENGEMLEYARVHNHYYGTLKKYVLDILDRGVDVLLDIDVQGAASIRNNPDPKIRNALVDVFIMPPTLAELERRLRKRGTETEEEIQRRLETGRYEMSQWPLFRYTILSGSTEEDLQKFRAIVRAERYLSKRLTLHLTPS
ncbi:MAG: guanylate kinase [Methylacidiphilales bacterium]|nr:guanylate kinase [Candidatus Methylacidiphilales bacterium]MDW8349501.1 guanylate kinase [Verrucomicrobiae bacterium]